MQGTAVLALILFPLAAFPAQDRITGRIENRQRVVLKGGIHPNALPQYDQGPVEPSFRISHVTLGMKRSAGQQADLEKLLAEQQDPASPQYHKWLTPEDYAARFGLSQNDIGKIAAWLRSQGLTVETVARGRNWISFSGTAGQVQEAFQTEIHRYKVNGSLHFANAREPSVPAALGAVTGGFAGLDDFRWKPAQRMSPRGVSGDAHILAPDDFATIYNITPLYQGGFDGSGQKIAITGQTAIDVEDIRTFRSRFNLPQNDPQVVLYGEDPGVRPGELGEAEADVELAGAVARNATIVYVYSSDVLLSAVYAIDQNLAPVISHSYGACETRATYQSLLFRSIVQQANAQGITFVAGSGDAGAAACDAPFFNPVATNGMAVLFPASIPEVTAAGGTMFNEGSGNYWSSNGGALSYIPETAWNDTVASGVLGASGGGASSLYVKPSWQTGPGVPSDDARDVPDVSLTASPFHDGYEVCTSGNCPVFGGTSAAAPSFAGIVALRNQYAVFQGLQAQPGMGNINPVLYRLARVTTDIFHDITMGDNIVPCLTGTPDCQHGSFGYSAGIGYDPVTGLGSVDAYNLVTRWDTQAPGASITVTANPSTISMSESTTLTVTVNLTSGVGTPTGTVTFNLVNTPIAGTTLAGGVWLGTATLAPSGGGASATLRIYGGQLGAGTNTIVASYSGDRDFAGSSAQVTVAVTVPTANSAVVPSVFYIPVIEQPPDSQGFRWFYTVTLTEVAGTGTTLTDFTIGGTSYASQIASLFGSATIPAHGSISASLGSKGLTAPTSLVFGVQRQGCERVRLGPATSRPVHRTAAVRRDHTGRPGQRRVVRARLCAGNDHERLWLAARRVYRTGERPSAAVEPGRRLRHSERRFRAFLLCLAGATQHSDPV